MKKEQKKYSIKKTGETLIEVLIAIVILVIFLSSILVILNRAIMINSNIENRITALSLAREGIEGVRHIRDTNWLRFSGNKRENWLCIDTDCNEKINDGFYRLDFDPPLYVLSEQGALTPLDESYRLYSHEDTPFLNHDTVNGSPTLFYRQIQTRQEEVSCPLVDCPNKLIVQSRVSWQEANGDKEIVLETHLFDYFERDAY